MMRPWSSKEYETRTAHGFTGMECCICGKTTNETLMVCCSPENGTFCDPGETPEASLYYIGPDCAKKLKKEMPEVTIVKARGK